MGINPLSGLAAESYIVSKHPGIAISDKLEAVKAIIEVAKIIQNGNCFDREKAKLLGGEFKLPENATAREIFEAKKELIRQAFTLSRGEARFISFSQLGFSGHMFCGFKEDKIYLVSKSGPPASGTFKQVFPSVDLLSATKLAMIYPTSIVSANKINGHELSIITEIASTALGRKILPKIFFINENALAGRSLLDDTPIMVQEWGIEDLDSYLRRMNSPNGHRRIAQSPGGFTFELEKRLLMAIQILDILDILKQLNIVHRDIKAPNFMIIKKEEGFPEIKIIDFGLALLREKDNEDQILQPMTFMEPKMAEIALAFKKMEEIFWGLRDLKQNLKKQKMHILKELANASQSRKKELLQMMHQNAQELTKCQSLIEIRRQENREMRAKWRNQMDFSYDVWRCSYLLSKVFGPRLSKDFKKFLHKFFTKGLRFLPVVGVHRTSAIMMARLNKNAKVRDEFSRFEPKGGIEGIIYGMLRLEKDRLTAAHASRVFRYLGNYWFPEAADREGVLGEEDLGGAGGAGTGSV